MTHEIGWVGHVDCPGRWRLCQNRHVYRVYENVYGCTWSGFNEHTKCVVAICGDNHHEYLGPLNLGPLNTIVTGPGKYRLRDGREAYVIGPNPIKKASEKYTDFWVGVRMQHDEHLRWTTDGWNEDGSYCYGEQSAADIVERIGDLPDGDIR